MADTYHIIDGKVIPFSGGRKCNDTGAWRDATPLELQLQEQLEEYERIIDAQTAEIEALRAEVERLKSMTAVTMGVGSGDGNLFVHGDYDSIKAAQALVFRAERLAEALNISPDDVGRIMHESWSRTKRSQGFHHPSECPNGRWVETARGRAPCPKCHADLIPWDSLPEPQKDINRHAFDDVLAEIRRRAAIDEAMKKENSNG